MEKRAERSRRLELKWLPFENNRPYSEGDHFGFDEPLSNRIDILCEYCSADYFNPDG